MTSRHRVRASLICAIVSLSGGTTLAQGILEEVVVTATKRAESIQDVPVSVSTISSEQIGNQGILDMEDLSLYVPNFEINSASILPNLYMRGLGPGATHSIEQSVGRFVDGVYISRAAINLHGFMDVENVEALRGPQGTLFGKNTVAGALIINTADPTDTFESGFSVSNAADSSSDGVEIDLTWAVNETWTLGANAAVTDASFDSFPGAECHAGTPVTPDPVTGTCDLAGLPLIFAPELKGTVFADFLVENALGSWDLGGRFDYTHSGEHYTDISYQDNVLTDAYSIGNASLRLIAPNERLTVSLIGTNLSDEAFCAWCIPSGPNVLAAMNAPREIGLRFSAAFD